MAVVVERAVPEDTLAHAVHDDGAVDSLGDGGYSVGKKKRDKSARRQGRDRNENERQETYATASDRIISIAEPPPAAAEAMTTMRK